MLLVSSDEVFLKQWLSTHDTHALAGESEHTIYMIMIELRIFDFIQKAIKTLNLTYQSQTK